MGPSKTTEISMGVAHVPNFDCPTFGLMGFWPAHVYLWRLALNTTNWDSFQHTDQWNEFSNTSTWVWLQETKCTQYVDSFIIIIF